MPRSSCPRASNAERANLYDEITTRIIAELEAGRLPWIQPWGTAGVSAPLAMPKNASTGRAYSGVNILILWGAVVARGFSCQSWLTFRQALSLGGNVRKGERGTTVVYADRFIPDDEKRRARETGDDAQAIPFLKRFTVFSTDQCEGLPEDLATAPPPLQEGLILPEVEALIRASGADLRLGGDKAFYAPGPDYIQVPRPEAYFEPISWHRTARHELSHWSGAPHRLGRDLSGGFGSKLYAKEELVAEISAAFLCATLTSVAIDRTDRGDDARISSAAAKIVAHLFADVLHRSGIGTAHDPACAPHLFHFDKSSTLPTF